MELVPGTDLAGALVRPCSAVELKVGGEFELLAVDAANGRPVPYDGPRGIAALFAALLAAQDALAPEYEGTRIIALHLGPGSKLTLEPGGQIEFSGAPYAWRDGPLGGDGASGLDRVAQALRSSTRQLAHHGRAFGLGFYQGGCQPFFAIEDVPWMPKGRYVVMREHLARTGDQGHRMMKETASIQVNLDATSAEDLARKYRVAMRFSPVATAMFANSPVREGTPSGFLCERAEIWRRTDPARCGLVRAAFDEGFGLDDYVRHALEVPMMFVRRDGRYHPMEGIAFSGFLERGHLGFRATWEDWTLHLSTLFPDVRLKGHLEIRCADAMPPPLSMAPLALWTGLLYDAAALDGLEQLVRGWSYEAVSALAADVPGQGLSARIGGRTASELASEALALARAGLSPGDRRYLDPLAAQLAQHGEPARTFLAGWASGWASDLGAFLAANGIDRAEPPPR